ncbi:MAG TPA: penicillin acylase family protein, partial [Candidatus Binatia bacterium]
NYLYADSGGNIGYSLAGAVPLRAGRPSLLPLDGAESKAEWQGSIPFDELPHLYNPPEGVIATANNDVAGGGYEYYLSDLFDPPYRIRRIRELLAGKKTLAVADMERMQQDTVSVHAREIVEALGADLARIAASGGASAKAAESLLAWDGGSPAESREAAVFQFFYHRLTENLLQPTLGENLFSTYIEIFNQSVYPLEQILKDPASPWFAAAPRPALVEKSLEQACGELARRLGPDMEQWQWGKVHTLGLGHPLDAVWMLRRLISIEPFPTGGDGVTINMGFFRRSHPYEHTVGPSLRMILDLAVPGRSLFVLVPGQSGHFLSPHYRDQTDLWRGGGYIEMAGDEKTAGPLVLTPQYKVPDPAAQTE